MRIDVAEGTIVAGKLLKDPESRTVGNGIQKADFFVSYGRNEGDKINVTAWRSLADMANMARKGDSIAVMGSVSHREYNGKTYTNLDADWISITSPRVAKEDLVPLKSDDIPFPWEQ